MDLTYLSLMEDGHCYPRENYGSRWLTALSLALCYRGSRSSPWTQSAVQIWQWLINWPCTLRRSTFSFIIFQSDLKVKFKCAVSWSKESKPQSLYRYSRMKSRKSTVSWCTPVSPALGRLSQEDCEFEAGMDFIEKLSQKASSLHNFWTSNSISCALWQWNNERCTHFCMRIFIILFLITRIRSNPFSTMRWCKNKLFHNYIMKWHIMHTSKSYLNDE
jgi:hypothetical protein